MGKPEKSPRKELIVAIIGVAVALLGTSALLGKVRAVDILTIFAGGFTAGGALVGAVVKFRAARRGEG